MLLADPSLDETNPRHRVVLRHLTFLTFNTSFSAIPDDPEPPSTFSNEPVESHPTSGRDGGIEWRTAEGKRHREDGPAVLWADGDREWWQWGVLHRIDGPAIEYGDLNQEWWMYGMRHRADGPALLRNGTRKWFQRGMKHRVDGPAVEWPEGRVEYWQHGALHREGGLPAIDDPHGTQEWWEKGNRHRVDGPAVVEPDGNREWWQDGERHRVDGPAVERADGRTEIWIEGEQIVGQTQLVRRAQNPNLSDRQAMTILSNTEPATLTMISRIISHNPSPRLSNKTRAFAALTAGTA